MYRIHTLVIVFALVVLALPGTARAEKESDNSPLFDIPRLANIKIDGDASDWQDRGFRVGPLLTLEGRIRPPADYDNQFRLAWDEEGLLFLGIVRDNRVEEADKPSVIGGRDAVEIFVAPKRGEASFFQAQIAPGADPKQSSARFYCYDYRKDKETLPELAVETAGKPTRDGYIVEARLPWSNLAITPGKGREIAVQVWMTDSDRPGDWFRTLWYPAPYAGPDNTLHLHRVRLSEKAGPPELVVANGHYELFRRVRIAVHAAAELAGKQISVKDGRRRLCRGRLELVDDRRAETTFAFPVSPAGEAFEELTIHLGRKTVATIKFGESPGRQRAKALMWIDPKFRPCVFHGKGFPRCGFDNSHLIEDLLGSPFVLRTTFYNRNHQEVDIAETPGRYGAVVEIIPERGRAIRRFRTLFRTPDRVNWRDVAGDLRFPLPEGLGIAPEVAREQAQGVGRHVAQRFEQGLYKDNRTAVMLAGLHETSPGLRDLGWNELAEDRDRQWWVAMKRKLYGNDERFPKPFVCPRTTKDAPAPVLREGSLQEAGMKPDAADNIDAVCREWAADSDEAFAVCVARHGVIVLHKAYGTRHGKPMTVDTPSWMASSTKMLSGTLVMMLVDQGLISLDDRPDKFLPPLEGLKTANGKPITIRQMYVHTAGMEWHWGDHANDMAECISSLWPHYRPGEFYRYDGTGMALTGKILEQISDESLPNFGRRHLFGPLGCKSTEIRDASHGTASIPLDIARVCQMLLNKGAYGNMRFMSAKTWEKMLPKPLAEFYGQDAAQWQGCGVSPGRKIGIGTVGYADSGLGESTFGHHAGSSATIRIAPESDIVVVMTRNHAGKNHRKYHSMFIQAVAEGMK